MQELVELVVELALLGVVKGRDLVELDVEGAAEELLVVLAAYEGSRLGIATGSLVDGFLVLVDSARGSESARCRFAGIGLRHGTHCFLRLLYAM